MSTENSVCFTSGGERVLCLMIHGLAGNFKEDYWGDVPELLRYQPEIVDIEVCFWGYKSSKSPLANFFALFFRGRKVASVAEVASDLESFIVAKLNSRDYQQLLLVGHSLGGLVAVATTQRLVSKGPYHNSIRCMLLASPQQPHWLARILVHISRSNPHLVQLASKRRMNRAIGVTLDNLRTYGVKFGYTHYSLDELITFNEDVDFDDRMSCEATHSWMRQPTTRKTPAYRLLVQWIAQTACRG